MSKILDVSFLSRLPKNISFRNNNYKLFYDDKIKLNESYLKHIINFGYIDKIGNILIDEIFDSNEKYNINRLTNDMLFELSELNVDIVD